MKYLLDTNVLCEATAKNPEAAVLSWIESHQLTVVTRNTADFPADIKTFNPWNHR